MRNVQVELARLGYDVGPLDGGLGPKTRNAIVDFQSATNVAVTGDVSNNLLTSLRNTRQMDNSPSNDMPYTKMVQLIEVELTRLGWDVGKPDGEWGSRSRSAAREFQSKIGVPVDGIADNQLLTQLQHSSRQGNTQTIINNLAQQLMDALQSGN